jgi:hypothetical protein
VTAVDEHRWLDGVCVWCHATEPGRCPWSSAYLVWWPTELGIDYAAAPGGSWKAGRR